MVAEYKCKPGLRLSTTHPWLICRSKKWLGTVPSCIEIDDPSELGNDLTYSFKNLPCYGGRGNCDHLCTVKNKTEVCSCYKGFYLEGNVCRGLYIYNLLIMSTKI